MGNLATSIPPDPSAQRLSFVRWKVVFLLMAISFTSWFNRVSMVVAGDLRIMEQFSISETQMGMVYSAFFFVYAAMMVPGGWFTDRKGPTLALFLMGIGTGLFAALTGVLGWLPLPEHVQVLGSSFGTMFLLLLLVRGTMGFFAVPMYPSSGRMVASWVPLDGRSFSNGLITAAALVGNASTFILFGAMVDRFDWPLSFVIAGAATLVLALVWVMSVRDTPLHASGDPEAKWARLVNHHAEAGPLKRGWGSWQVLLTHRGLMMLTLSYAAVGYFQYLFFFWTHHYFGQILHLGASRSRLYATLVNLSMAVGMASGGYLSDYLQRLVGYRRGRSLVPVGGMLASAVFLGLGLQVSDPNFIVLWFALALGTLGMCEGPFWSTAIELGGSRGATAAGVVNTGGNVGGLIAPVLTPWVKSILPQTWDENDRWRVAIGIGSLVVFLGAGLWYWIDPRERLGSLSEEVS